MSGPRHDLPPDTAARRRSVLGIPLPRIGLTGDGGLKTGDIQMSIVDEMRTLVDHIAGSKQQRRAFVQQMRGDVADFMNGLRASSEQRRSDVSYTMNGLRAASDERRSEVGSMLNGLRASSDERRSEVASMLGERACLMAELREVWQSRGARTPGLFSAPEGEEAPKRPRRRPSRARRGR